MAWLPSLSNPKGRENLALNFWWDDRVRADAQHHHALLAEAGHRIPKVAGLLGASRRVVLGIEVEHHLPASKILEGHGLTLVVGAREIRGLAPCLEHAILLASLWLKTFEYKGIRGGKLHRPWWRLQATRTPYPNRRRSHRKAPGKDIREGDPPRARRGKELSTKGHEGRRRATKGLEKAQEASAKGWEERKDFQKGAEVSVSETPLFRPIGSVPTSGTGAWFSEKRGHGMQANGSFPKEAGRLSEKSPAGHRRRTIGTTPPGSAGVPPHPLPLPAQFPRDSNPAGGNRMGPAEAEPWRRCRSIRVEEMGEAVPGFVRAGRPRSRGGFIP